jgi:hypothetical protein
MLRQRARKKDRHFLTKSTSVSFLLVCFPFDMRRVLVMAVCTSDLLASLVLRCLCMLFLVYISTSFLILRIFCHFNVIFIDILLFFAYIFLEEAIFS